MKATVMYAASDVRVEKVPDARLVERTDALVRVTHACICGSDLWPYKKMERSDVGNRMGHEFIGLVEAVGADVRTVKRGDLVVAPFAWSDGTCVFCRQGLQTSCLHGGWWGGTELDGGQGEAVRIPQADGTLVVLLVGRDHALMPSLLTLSDVMGPWRPLRPRVRRPGTVDAHGDEHRPAGRRRRPGRRAAGRVDAGRQAHVLQQRHDRRRAGSGAGLHRGAAS